jgi:hypothetical protein
MTAEKTDWLSGHIEYLSKLKSPTDTQKLLLSLAAKKVRDTKDDRTLALLIKSEKALERAKKAQAEVSSLLVEEKRKAAKEERAGRTHKLIQLGLLFSYAELDESPRDFLAGLLLFGAKMPEIDRVKLTTFGAQLLSEKEKAPAAAPAPAKAPAPAPAPRPAPAPLITDVDMPLTKANDDSDIKRLGARFKDGAWYVPAGVDARPFLKWL